MINVVYASDDNFAEIMGISILSLLENNKKAEEICIHILEDSISDINKKRLLELTGIYNRKIIFYDVKKYLTDDMKQQRGSLSTFSRLFMTDILPADVTKALYIDCDTLVVGSVEELYNTDLNGFYGAGVKDPISIHHFRNIGLSGKENYINAGILLINLEKWRNENAPEKFMAFFDKYNGDVPYADQGIINGVMADKIKQLDLKYNCYTMLYDFTYKKLQSFRHPVEYYTQEQFNRAKREPVIIHFTTSFASLRPWIEGSRHPYAQQWLKYKSASPWKNEPFRKDNRSGKKKLMTKIYNVLPDFIAVRAVGILHSTIMPKLQGRNK